MDKVGLIILAITIFIMITILYYKLTARYAEKENGIKMWKKWSTRAYYWTGLLWYSGGGTVLVIFLLKCANVVTI